MDQNHPFYAAWQAMNGDGPPPARAQVIAKILIGDPSFHPRIIGLATFRACVDEIRNDPDTYDSEEIQIWAGNQFLEHTPASSFLDGPVLESI
ncbi:MAG: hypothetical protein HY454_00605 [Parcubacteria group bacterium]|nr:hypothetical protein [Parcubacteria group bacterium]